MIHTLFLFDSSTNALGNLQIVFSVFETFNKYFGNYSILIFRAASHLSKVYVCMHKGYPIKIH
jgi:hypothetical protein